ncbi:MAG: glycosyl hydrolase, partial [Proteobacteria bacterium]
MRTVARSSRLASQLPGLAGSAGSAGRLRWARAAAALALPCVGLFVACGSESEGGGGPDGNEPDSSFRPTDSGAGPQPDGASSSSGGLVPGSCATHFRYVPPSTSVVHIVRVTGEWNGFATSGPELVRQADGAYEGDVVLPQGRIGYKLLVDGAYLLDPQAPFHKFVGGEENSAVDVGDCALPTLSASEATREPAGFHALVQFAAGGSGAPIDDATVSATLRKDFEDAAPIRPSYTDSREGIAFFLEGLSPGKYTLFVNASDTLGNAAKPLRLVFWVEARKFDWQGTVIYMGMNDRVKNGDPGNDAPNVPAADPKAQFYGGDLEGMRQLVASNYLDELGVGAIWLSPFNVNPEGAFASGDPNHPVTGYHGYWPTRAREVDTRLGGAAALRALVKEAHAHGIRVLQDFVLNHVHEQHEYVSTHPDWFRTSCVCGTDGCGWTERRLDCLFTPYLPDVNWSVSELSQQMEQDAAWWVDQFDLDGLRVDAVKHVEDLAVINLSSALRHEFEASGQKLFLTGETAMGWNDCGTPGCIGNEENYGTISRYIGPRGLDGQFDFVLYHAAPLSVFAYENKSLYHA